MALSSTCRFAAHVSVTQRHKYRLVANVIHFMERKRPFWELYARLWRYDGGVCTLPQPYWVSLLPMSRLQYALYFALMMSLFPCQSPEWLAVVHPHTLCVKHLPSYHGYVFMHSKLGDISFPVFADVIVDAIVLSVVRDPNCDRIDVSVRDYLTTPLHEARIDDTSFQAQVDLHAFNLFVRNSKRLLNIHDVLDLVDELK